MELTSAIVRMVYKAFVSKYKLSADTVIMAGAALAMHGLRERAHDIDLQVTREDFEKLRQAGYEVRHATPRGRLNGEWIYLEDYGTSFDITMGDYSSSLMDGVPVMTLPALLELKMAFQREKDMPDIAAIQQALSMPV